MPQPLCGGQRPRVLAVTPTAGSTVNQLLGQVELTFDSAMSAASFTTVDAALTGPNGFIPLSGATTLASNRFRVSFPAQRLNGAYSFTAGPQIADVAGKGLSAALLTAKLQATLRALVGECGSLARLGECVNQIMYRDGVRGRFATLVWLGLNTADGGVRVLNAGHMPPLVVSPTGVEPLPRGSMALGMVPAAAFTGCHPSPCRAA